MESAINFFPQFASGLGGLISAGKLQAGNSVLSITTPSNIQGVGGLSSGVAENFNNLLSVLQSNAPIAESLPVTANPLLAGQKKLAYRSALEIISGSSLPAAPLNRTTYNALPGTAVSGEHHPTTAATRSDSAPSHPAPMTGQGWPVSELISILTPPANAPATKDGDGASEITEAKTDLSVNRQSQSLPYHGLEIIPMSLEQSSPSLITQTEPASKLSDDATLAENHNKGSGAGLALSRPNEINAVSNEPLSPTVISGGTGMTASNSAEQKPETTGKEPANILTNITLPERSVDPAAQNQGVAGALAGKLSQQPTPRPNIRNLSPAADSTTPTAGTGTLSQAQADSTTGAQPGTKTEAQDSQPSDASGQTAANSALSPRPEPLKSETQAVQANSSGQTANASLTSITAPLITAVNSSPDIADANLAGQTQEEEQQITPAKNGQTDSAVLKDRSEIASAQTAAASSAPKSAQNAATMQNTSADGQNFAQTLTPQYSAPAHANPRKEEVSSAEQANPVEVGNALVVERQEAIRTHVTGPGQRPDVPSHPASPPIRDIVLNIVQHADNGVNRFQLRLDPPELGRVEVRMEISAEGKLTAVIAVERPETLDLLQRDARALERSLEEAGLKTGNNSLSFSLKGGRQEYHAQEPSGMGRLHSDSPLADDHDGSPPSASYRFASRAVNITI
jgi:flagellar hook-length control protein FliK